MQYNKLKYLILLIVLSIFLCGNLSAQINIKTKVKELLNQANSNAFLSIDRKYKLVDSAYYLARKSNDFNLESEALLRKGALLIDIGRYQPAIDTLTISLKLFRTVYEETGIAYNLTLLGRAYTQIGMYQIANEYFKQAQKIYDAIGTTNLINRKKVYIELGTLYNYWGLLHKRLNNEPIALQYHQKEYKIYSDIQDSLLMGACLGDIGRIYRNMNLLDSALYYTYKGYIIVRKYGETIFLANIEKKMGLVHLELKDYIDALNYLNSALNKFIKFDDKQGIVVCKNSIGRINCKIGNFKAAHLLFDEALQLASDINDVDDLLYSYLFKAEAYYLNNQPQESLEYYKKYHTCKDSIYQMEKEVNIRELEIQYKFKEQQTQISSLKDDSQRMIYYISSAVIIILLIIIVLLYSRYKMKAKLNSILIANNDELNKVYTDAVVSKQEVDNLINVKQNMIQNISTESHTPFNIMFGYLNLLKIEIKKYNNSTANLYIDQINTNANSLLGTINDISELNKIENSDYKLIKNEFILRDLFNLVSETMTPKANDKFLDISFICSDDISLKTDYKILERILIHLIDNSIKYTNVGFIRITANLQINSDSKEITTISVEDSGIGISKAKINNILAEYKSEPNNTDLNDERYGLGLAITKNFVDLLGGRLEIYSEKEKGTKINVYLYSEN